MNVMWLLNGKNIIGRDLGSFYLLFFFSLQSASKLLTSDSETYVKNFQSEETQSCLCLPIIFLFFVGRFDSKKSNCLFVWCDHEILFYDIYFAIV